MKQWIVDAKDIGEISKEDLVITPSIKEFITPSARDTMYFVVAPKGLGKTLLLLYKRYLYQVKHKGGRDGEEIYFIPHDTPVDRNVGDIPLSYEKIHLLSIIENWVNIWSLCISLSIIKTLKSIYERKGDEERRYQLIGLIKNLPDEICELIDNPLLFTPYGYLSTILRLNYGSIYKIIGNQYLLLGILREVRSAVAIFIDNTDECFSYHLRRSDSGSFSGEISPDVWYAAQIGLMSAIWSLSGLNRHLKIFASIRKEAYLKLLKTDDRGLQMMGSALDIEYSKAELKEIFIKNIKSMDKRDLVNPSFIEKDPIYSFLGLEGNKITNALVGNQEDIFEYICRHTLKRPRDLMVVGIALTNIGVNERTYENIRAAINEVATMIAETYMYEMKPHLDFDQFEALFDLIHSNILTEKEIREICRRFNEQKTCENRNCKECEETHVFCNLYKIGLLGVVYKNPLTAKTVQKFEKPGERVFESNILPQSEFYLIHPILNSLIYKRNMLFDGGTYYINPRTIVGDGYAWKYPRIYGSTRYCSFINRICSTDRFLNKRGVFLASSYNKKEVIEELSEKLQELNLPIEMDRWTKRESLETGLIFCDEVCPKLFKNLWMIAEVSDFNPNVFFECGFAIGLGRNVVFLCDEKADLIKYMPQEQLYLSYKTVEDILTKLGWTPDTFHDIAINSLYKVPKVFKHIKNFDSRNDRTKSDDIFVLSFHQETDIIRELSKVGYKIIESNRLNQTFMSEDLVEELINARAVLVNLSGLQREPTMNMIHDCQLMCLAGICVSQGVPVRVFQANDIFYSDVHVISVGDISEKHIIDYVNDL